MVVCVKIKKDVQKNERDAISSRRVYAAAAIWELPMMVLARDEPIWASHAADWAVLLVLG